MSNNEQRQPTDSVRFAKREYLQQEQFFAGCAEAETGYRGQAVRLMPHCHEANFHPDYRKRIADSFSFSDDETQLIGWHTHANHGASSQVCCVNFLFPFVDRPDLLGRWIGHVLGIKGAQPEVIERRNGEDHYVAFEWFPETDYLNEASKDGKRSRGSNSTSVDAAVRYRLGDEMRLLLIEWKYTESYPSRRGSTAMSGDLTRIARYQKIWQRPHGPIRADLDVRLEEFFLEPWYQLLRQQMTAYHAEIDPLSIFDRATLLHISPKDNIALRSAKGELARFGEDAFDVFQEMIDPAFRDRFISMDTSEAFSCLRSWPDATWSPWLSQRYPVLHPSSSRDDVNQ
ncbi:PGN_0703 family putative restriction endonuclease [Parasphingorhabdus sp.]|uniref:PGN_0703 family putative restriction endonuclease n=1 Tax=Parasphingorhabdus sp. TaxID=2709688 RepID=UPI00300309F3